jgi:hypothetical protein
LKTLLSRCGIPSNLLLLEALEALEALVAAVAAVAAAELGRLRTQPTLGIREDLGKALVIRYRQPLTLLYQDFQVVDQLWAKVNARLELLGLFHLQLPTHNPRPVLFLPVLATRPTQGHNGVNTL